MMPELSTTKKPYPMLGAYVVVQYIGNGDYAVVAGANSESKAQQEARKYPGETKVVPNRPGDSKFPGTL